MTSRQLFTEALAAMDRLHELLTVDELYPTYRDDLEEAIAVSTRILDRAGQLPHARARRLTEPTGQPPPPDPDRREPVHASSPGRRPSLERIA